MLDYCHVPEMALANSFLTRVTCITWIDLIGNVIVNVASPYVDEKSSLFLLI